MPATTTCMSLPYPVDADPPDVPFAMQELAEAVDAVLCSIIPLPIGAIIPWWDNGDAPPSGLLRCNGAVFNPAIYPDLQTHLGGTTLPNLEGKFLRGTGGAFPTNAQTGGFDDATLVNHEHSIEHDHAVFNTGDDTHSHTQHSSTLRSNNTGNVDFDVQASAFFAFSSGTPVLPVTDDTHNHTVNVPNYTGNSATVGQSATNRNLPPFYNVTFLIKAVP